MRLHIVLGYPARGPHAQPTLVYAGNDPAAAQAAIASSPHPYHQLFKNPVGVWKHNAAAAANSAKECAGASDANAVIEVTSAEMREYESHLKSLNDTIATQQQEITNLREALTKASVPASPEPPAGEPAAPAAEPSTESFRDQGEPGPGVIDPPPSTEPPASAEPPAPAKGKRRGN